MEIDFSLLELYSESDLKDEIQKVKKNIKFQQEQCLKLAKALEFLKSNRDEVERALKESRKKENLQTCQDKAEIIEKKISDYMIHNWKFISLLFKKVDSEYLPLSIHSDSQKKNVVLPRQIMVYFIAQLSGLTKQQIADYFEFETHASVLHSIRVVENLCREKLFEIHVEKIRTLLKNKV